MKDTRAKKISLPGNQFLRGAGVLSFLMVLVFTAGKTARLSAQGTETGSIVGTVMDPAKAVVPQADVSVTNEATGVERSAKTNGAGLYEFAALPVGTYAIRVTKAGFATTEIPHILLSVGARYGADVSLQVGAVTQQVQVTGEAPLLQTQTNTVSQVVSNRTINEMPLNGRDFEQLMTLTPGVILTSGSTGPTASGLISYVNGMRREATGFRVDGADVTQQAFSGTEFIPPIDALDEFNEVASNASAEYGFGPATVSVAIKSGTNELHGTLWEFVRNKAFDSRNFFSPTTQNLKRNQFGAAVGGPVVKNRLFFFGSFEGTRQSQGINDFSTVPLAAERTGDFSSLLGASIGTDALGRPVLADQIFDPLTSRNVTAGQADPLTGRAAVSTGIVREPFTNNIIPTARVNSASQLIQQQFIPLPNSPGLFNNFRTFPSGTNNPTTFLAKVDSQITPKDRIFFTGGLYYNIPATPGPYPPSNQGLVESRIPGENAVLGWTRTLSPSTLLTARISDSWVTGIFQSPATDPNRGAKDLLTQWGVDPVIGGLPYHATTPGIPTVSITGMTGTAGLSHFPTGWRMNQVLWSADISTLRGKHALQFGYSQKWWKGGFFAQGDHRGNWQFDGRFTNQPGTVGGQGQVQAMADFLLGFPQNSVRTAPWSWFYFHFRNHWAYIQDNYKIKPSLTLNFGLRYEYNPWPAEIRGQFSNWIPNGRNGRGVIVIPSLQSVQPPNINLHPPTAAWMQLFNSLGIVETAAQAGIPTNMRDQSKKDFAPRVGFAWSVRRNTIIRGGYGLYFIPADLNHNLPDTGVGPPFIDRTTPLPNTEPIPVYNIQNSYCRSLLAAFPGQCVAGDPFSFPAFPGNPGGDVHERLGYVQQWNLDIQRSFAANWLIDFAYIGSAGHHLEGAYPVNNPLPGVGPLQPRRPYPDFGTITLNKGQSNSRYDSFQAKLERQFARGLSLLAAYTASKSIDDNSDGYGGPLNPHNLRQNKAVSSYDVPQRVSIGYVFDLPIPRQAGALRYVVNGWRTTGIIAAQSGMPYTVRWPGDPTNTGGGTVPDRVCSGKLASPTIQRWFDTSCFASPSPLPGTNGLVTNYGNSGRDILRADGPYSFDLGLFKEFDFTERYRLQFRSEFFNEFNNVYFGAPASTVNVPGAGVVSTAGPPRIIQFGLKMYF